MNNDRKELLLHLYGEKEKDSDLRSLLENPDLKAEYTALSEAKFKLDLKKRDRPDRLVMDTIMAAAKSGDTTVAHRPRADRGPVQRFGRLRKVLVPAVSIAAVLVLSVGVSWYAMQSGDSSSSAVSAFVDDSIVPPESLYRFVPSGSQAVNSTAQALKEQMAWDDGETLQNLNGRINKIKPSDLLDWGEAAVPLESLPNSNRSGFQTAGSTRN